MSYRLYTTFYREWNSRRRAELVACLAANCVAFDEVTVLSENCPRPLDYRGKWFEGRQRQQYRDLLALAAESGPEDIVVLANTDIMFAEPGNCQSRETIDKLSTIDVGEVYALTRWDIMPGADAKLFDAAHSQDAWVFRGPPKESISGSYYFGHPGVDNRLAHELQAAGYKVLNPSLDVRTYHLHLSGHRPGNTPENRVKGPYLFVAPHNLGEQPKYKRPVRESRRASQFQG